MHRFLALLLFAPTCCPSAELFQDRFDQRLKSGWSWVREDPAGWRVTPDGLELRVLPGNMWGPSNNAKNVLLRPAPDPGEHSVEVTVRVRNQPTEQYEQVDLVWYYDDSHMVKIGQELVDGQLSIVMGREEQDKTRTLAIIPIKSVSVELRLRVDGDEITGSFRAPDETDWRKAGTCTVPKNGPPQISLQAYQGPATEPHWARINMFRILRPED